MARRLAAFPAASILVGLRRRLSKLPIFSRSKAVFQISLSFAPELDKAGSVWGQTLQVVCR
jgi:hypothetical protein